MIAQRQTPEGAGGRTRTDGLRFTKPLLYQLSYSGLTSCYGSRAGARFERAAAGLRQRELKAADPFAEERHDVVWIRIVPEHRLLEDELTVQVNVEDSAGSGHELDGVELLLPLLENPRRQTGSVRERSSGNAVLDPYAVSLRQEHILAN